MVALLTLMSILVSAMVAVAPATVTAPGDLHGALQTIDSIQRRSYKVDGLLAVVDAQLEAGGL